MQSGRSRALPRAVTQTHWLWQGRATCVWVYFLQTRQQERAEGLQTPSVPHCALSEEALAPSGPEGLVTAAQLEAQQGTWTMPEGRESLRGMYPSACGPSEGEAKL